MQSAKSSRIEDTQDIRYLMVAHEKCVKEVKEKYVAIVFTHDDIYEQTYEPESTGLGKVLSKESILSANFLLDFSLPLIAKLKKCLQTEKLDLTDISSLVDATIHTLESR